MQPFAGKTALVTGASRGIGRAVSELFAAEGARVITAARTRQALGELVAELPGEGHRALELDVADPAAIERALAAIGRVDFLISNAGIAESKPFDKSDDAMFERLFQVNTMASVRLCRLLLPAMIREGFGRVVIVASNAALSGYGYSSAYCASKHAVVGWMRAVALEIAKTGVTINAVCPGWVETDMARDAVRRIAEKTGRSEEQAQSVLSAMSPQNRMLQPEEVAHLVAMLCRDEARSIHGQALVIDGGQLLR
jgi:NAD(P)-dependent dehydrogenase (short-subunit alcohol dehydrogenase family)